jgi:hypothetical protein
MAKNVKITLEDGEDLIGKRVMVEHKGLLLTGILRSVSDRFGGRASVQLPNDEKPRDFWLTKITVLPPKNPKKT